MDPAMGPVTIDCRLGDGEATCAEPTLVSGSSLDLVMDRLSPVITERAIRAQTGRLLMLHACGLADPSTGATVVLAATSGTGKTTLARTLGDQLAYVTDETIAITREGTVVPYPKPLSVLNGAGATYKDQTPASKTCLTAFGGKARVAAIAIMHRQPGRAGVEVERLATLHALAALAPHGSLLGELEHPLSWMADLLHRTGGLRLVRYAEASTLRPFVGSLLGAG